MTQKSAFIPEILKVFETIPDPYLVLSPTLNVLTASDAYLTLTSSDRQEVLGRDVFEIFPDTDHLLQAHFSKNLKFSLQKVIDTRRPHQMDLLPITWLLSQNTKSEVQYWQSVNTPVLDEEGALLYILHQVNDVTEQFNNLQQLKNQLAQKQTDFLKADSELKNLQSIFMQAPALICMFEGPSHVFKLVNPPYQQLVGDRELLGRPIREAMPELVDQPIYQLLDDVYQTGETFYANEMKVQLDHNNSGRLGENFYNFVYQATRNFHGEINGILVFAYEVTAQVVARKQADNSRKNVQILNEELAATNEELRAANEDLSLAKHALEELNFELEERVAARTKALKQAQHEAERQRQILHTLFMEAPAPIVILQGQDMVFQLVNPAYQQIFPGRVLMGKTLLEALPELANSPIPAILKKVYLTGRTFVAQEFPLMLARHQEGPLEEIYFTFTYQARHNRQGDIEGVLVFAYDVTDQVKARQKIEEREKEAQVLAQKLAAANQELASANEEIQASNEDLAISNQQLSYINADMDNFIYTASHDLRAPISNIEGLMSAIMRHLSEESRHTPMIVKLFGLISDSIERFKKTLNDLTQITKIQREEMGIDIHQVDLIQIIHEVMLDLANQIEQAEAEFILNMDECFPIRFSAKNARSIVYNLLSNAIKYRSPHRKVMIRIDCYREDHYQILSVADNGLGMDLTNESKIFAMFKRLHDHVEGSGVGLYIVKKIVENAGGKIEVQSKPNEGSTFRVFFKQPTKVNPLSH